MGFRYNVFLSHSQHDDAFAKSVAKMLRETGWQVWLDNWSSPPGRDLQLMLEGAMKESQHAVFIVTPEWAKGDWTTWECEYFREISAQDPTRILLPIFCRVKKSPLFPSNRITHLSWPPEADAETMFWPLWCGLNEDEELGDESEWLEKSRRKRLGPDQGPVLGEQTTLRRPAPGRSRAGRSRALETPAIAGLWDLCGCSPRGLSCDRSEQWGQLVDEIGSHQHEAIFVRGSQRRALDWFLLRVDKCLKHKDTEIKEVTWPNYFEREAMTDGKLKAWLARSFDCAAKDLAASLAAELDGRSLVLLHSTVCQDEVKNPFFVSYYTKVLPEVITQAEQLLGNRAGKVKIIQALAWHDKPLVMRWLASLLRRTGIMREADWIQHALEKQDVAKAIADISEEAVEHGLMVWPLQELKRIKRKDVQDLAKRTWAGEGEEKKKKRKKFVNQVMAGNRNFDQLIFQQIMKHLPEENEA